MEVALCRDMDWLLSEDAFSIYASCMYMPTYEAFRKRMDACFVKELYRAPGRRSKKREKEFLESGLFRDEINKLALEHGGKVTWNEPLRAARE